jgi:multidrug efflux system outer membrane protein
VPLGRNSAQRHQARKAEPRSTRPKKPIPIAALLAAAALLSGCIQGTDYTRPGAEAPTSFRNGPDNPAAASVADLPWWEVFNDPALKSIIQESLQNNYDLRLAINRIEQARAIQAAVASPLYPQIGYEGGLSAGKNSFLGSPAPGNSDTNTSALLALTATWELDLWGRIKRADEAALAQILAAEENRRAVMLTLVTSVAQAYFELLELDLELQIAHDNAASFQTSYDLFERRSTGGVSTRLAVLRAQAALSQVTATIPELQRQINVKENAISTLLGRVPGPITRGAALLEQRLPVEIPAGIPSDLIQRRPDIRRAEQNLVSANANVGVALAERFPRIGLTAFLGKASPELHDFTNSSSNAWALGLNAVGPIFTGGRTDAQIALAKAQYEQALLEYKQTVLNSFSEVSDTLIARDRLVEVERELTKQVDALDAAVDMSRQRYDVGKANYFEILDAQQLLYPAEAARARAHADQYIAVIQLYRTLGGGWNLTTDKWTQASP